MKVNYTWRWNVMNIDELKLYIEKMRTNLQFLINSKDDLLDVEIIRYSKKLDKAINNYNKLTICWSGPYKEVSRENNEDYKLHVKII